MPASRSPRHPSLGRRSCPINLTTVTTRPLHAVLLPPAEAGGRMFDALAAARAGSGPAILPLDPALPRARLTALLDALAPSAIETQDGIERPVSSRTGN